MRVLVTGGSGHLGRKLVRVAAEAGHDVRVLSRRPPPPETVTEWAQADLGTGDGIAEAVQGADAVVHSASDPMDSALVDVEGTRRLARAAREAGVGHFVFVSIVGVHRIPLPYYRHKLAAERLVAESGVPWSVMRVAQFHSFVDFLLRRVDRLPIILPVPAGFRVQSIDTMDVARRLGEVLLASPGGRLPDLVGPEVLPVSRAARMWVRARSLRKRVLPVPVPGATAAAFRRGFNTDPDNPSDGETWEAWLRRAQEVG